MWFAPSGGSWRRLVPAPLASFQGKEERGWLGGAGGAAFKMQSAQSLWSPPACRGGSAHAGGGGLLLAPAGAAAAAAAPLPPPSRAAAGRRARAPCRASPGRGTDALRRRRPCCGQGRTCLASGRGCPSGWGCLRPGAAGLAGRAAWLVAMRAGACLPGSLSGFFAYQQRTFLFLIIGCASFCKKEQLVS